MGLGVKYPVKGIIMTYPDGLNLHIQQKKQQTYSKNNFSFHFELVYMLL